ncbi:MAG: FAD-dependent oxidoreductase [Candidatus Heimdallarchaeota archaeon]|nr:MAG: FAD-dependent oxidoreductase [Candidatus Heimdallarchaeota archaeon]
MGGLLSAALLAKQGQNCFLAEKLPFFGGRFTSIRHQGFEIPTGAVHMIPHAHKGPLGNLLLQNLNLNLEVHTTENFTSWYWPSRTPIRHRRFWGVLKAFPKMRQRISLVRKLLWGLRGAEQHSESFREFLQARTGDPQIFKFFNAITGFALSLDISQISTASMYRVLKRLHEKGRPGVPVGGCKTVITALVNNIQESPSVLQRNCELKKLEIDGSFIESAVCQNTSTNEEFNICAKQFILNMGHSQVNQVLSNSHLPYRLPSAPIAAGGGFAYRSTTSILESSGIALFPENEYVKGAVEPTITSPNLAPPDEHLFITHQVFHSNNIVRDTRHARDELLATFPQLKEEDELCIHTFHKDWPVNYSRQGEDLSNFSSVIPNLFFVGDSYKGNSGWMMTEGIAYGVKRVIKRILNQNNN